MEFITHYWWLILLLLIGILINGIKALIKVNEKPYLDKVRPVKDDDEED